MIYYLPWPPSTNTYYRAVVRKKNSASGLKHYASNILSEKARDYKAAVKVAVGFCPAPIKVPVKVMIELNPPTRRAYDVDNRIKPILDALTFSGVWIDDVQVVEVTCAKREIVPGGRAKVIVYDGNGDWIDGTMETKND